MRRLTAAFTGIVAALSAATACGAPVRVLMATGAGPIVLELYPDKAPRSVADFLAYADKGLWNGTTFWRSVSPANDHNPATISVVQGGYEKDDGPLPPIPHETTLKTGLRHTAGVISFARGAPGTAGNAFFICTADDPALDFGGARNPDGQGFAAFGRVVSGMEAARRIHDAPLSQGGSDAYLAGQRLARPVPIYSVRRIR